MPKLFEDHRLGGKAAEAYTLDRLKASRGNSPLLEAAKSFDPLRDNFYIHGPVGCGKTHTATAIMAKIPSARIMRVNSISRFVRQAINSDVFSEDELIGLFCGKKVSSRDCYEPAPAALAIDDLGAEKLTEYAESVIFEIIDQRILDGLNGLVITSNLGLNDLIRRLGSERIASRIVKLCKVFDLSGEADHRLVNA